MKKLFNFNNKKLLSILLIVSILFSIVGCSKPNTTNTNNANQAKKLVSKLNLIMRIYI